LTLLFSIVVFLFEFYLSARQLANYRLAKSVPAELAKDGRVTEDTFKKSNAYQADKLSFGMFESLIMITEVSRTPVAVAATSNRNRN